MYSIILDNIVLRLKVEELLDVDLRKKMFTEFYVTYQFKYLHMYAQIRV